MEPNLWLLPSWCNEIWLSMADAKAGYFLNATIPAQSIVKPEVTEKENPDEAKTKDTSSSVTPSNK